jgi:hypothetical protein
MTSLRYPVIPTLAVLTCAALAWSAPLPAHAVELISTPASMCKPYGQDDLDSQLAMDSQAARLANSHATATQAVICPVVRQTAVGGAIVYVDGAVDNGATLDCTLYSYDHEGSFIASKSFSKSGPGYTVSFDQRLQLEASEAPMSAYLSTVCWLPPQARGRLFGVLSIK